MMLPLRLIVPVLFNPPPPPAVLPETTVLLSVRVPLLSMPPPLLAAPPEIVRPDMQAVTPAFDREYAHGVVAADREQAETGSLDRLRTVRLAQHECARKHNRLRGAEAQRDRSRSRCRRDWPVRTLAGPGCLPG